MIDIRPYKAEDALQIISDPDEIMWAKLHEIAGPGFTGLKDGKVLGCGGIRINGIGEIWGVFSPEVKDRTIGFSRIKKDLLEQSQNKVREMIKATNLWQVIATTKNISPQQANFLEHLGFEKSECYVYIRKDK